MSIQQLLVYTPIHWRWPAHVGYAARLAANWQAHLTGLYVRLSTDLAGPSRDPGRAVLREQELAEAAQAGATFADHVRTQGGGPDADWLFAEGEPGAAIALIGAAYDLAVLGVGEHSGSAGFEPLERILVESRTPCLLVPDSVVNLSPVFERIVIGWNGSIESMRTLRSALPLLRKASQVLLLKGSARDYRATLPIPPALNVEAYLARHGVSFEAAKFEDVHGDSGAALLASAEHHQADLLVMGAYGKNRVSEWLMGGATHHALRHARIPLLMQH